MRGVYTKQATQGSILVPDDGVSVETVSPRQQIPHIMVNNNIYVNTYTGTKQSARKREVIKPTVASVQEVIENPSSNRSGIHSPSKKSSDGYGIPDKKPCRGRSEVKPCEHVKQQEPAPMKKKAKKKNRLLDKTAIPTVPAEDNSPKPAIAKVESKGVFEGQHQGTDKQTGQSFLLPKKMRSQSENLTSGDDSLLNEPECQAIQETPAQANQAQEEAVMGYDGSSTVQDRDLSIISGLNGADSPLLKSPMKNKFTLQPIKPESRDILKSEIKLKIFGKNNQKQHSKKDSLNLKTDLSIDFKLCIKQTAGLVKANTQDMSKSFIKKQDKIKSPKTLTGLKPFELSCRLPDSVLQYLKISESPMKSTKFKKAVTSEVKSDQTIEQVPSSNIEAMQMVLKKNEKIHSAKYIQDKNEELSYSKPDLRRTREKSAVDCKKTSSVLQKSTVVQSKVESLQTISNSIKKETAKKSSKLDSSTSIKQEARKAPVSSHLKVTASQNDPMMAEIFKNKLNPAGSKVYSSATAVSVYSNSKINSSITKMTSVRNDSSVHSNLKPSSRITDSKASSMSKRVNPNQEIQREKSATAVIDTKRFGQATDQACREMNPRLHEKKPMISIYDCKITKEVPELAFKESRIADLKLSKSSIASKLNQDNNLFTKSAYRTKAPRGISRAEVNHFNSNLDLSCQEQTQHLNREKSPTLGLRADRTKKLFSSHFEKSNSSMNPKPTSQFTTQIHQSSHRTIEQWHADQHAPARTAAQPMHQSSRPKGATLMPEKPKAYKVMSEKSQKK